MNIFYQNLNSGNRRINGRNSSFDLVGNDGPSSVIKSNNSLKNTEKNTVKFKCTEFHLNSLTVKLFNCLKFPLPVINF